MPRNGSDIGITIYDIAEAAGVSPSTVSRALSKPGRLSAKTEFRIRDIAEKLGYLRINDNALSVSMPSTGIVAALIPDYLNPYYTRTLRGMKERLEARHYSLITLDSAIIRSFERRAISHLMKISEGIIIESSSLSEPDLIRYALVRPIVTINRTVTGLSSVTADPEQAINEAMLLLQRSGHRSVAYLASASTSWASELRRRSIRTAAYRYDLNYRVLRGFSPSIEGGEKAAKQYLSRPTDAVIAFNDQLAIGFIGEVQKAGMRVPEDISVVSFDNDPETELYTPALSTIDLHAEALGRDAADILLAQLRTPQRHLVNITEPSTFVSRESVSLAKRNAMKLGPYVNLQRQDSEVTVLTMLSSSFNEILPRINAFMREYPDIVIDPIEGHTQDSTIALYWERLQAKRSVPDLLNVEYDKMPQFAASGALLDIGTQQVERKWGREFNPSTWKSAHYAQGLYGIPGDQSQTVMFYRKDILQHYGLAVPSTWDQFYEEGVRLHQRNPNRYMGIIDTSDVQHYLSFFRMAGVKPWHIEGTNRIAFDLGNPEVHSTAEFIQQCLNDGVLKAEPLWDGHLALPQDDTYATFVHANWFGKIIAATYPGRRGLWKIALPPAFTDASQVKTAEIGGSLLTVSSRIPRNRQLLALKFAHWFQTEPVSVDMRAAGGYSATSYFQEKEEVLGTVDSYFQQRVYQVYAQSAKLVNRDWDCLPFATYLSTLFRNDMVNQLKPNAQSPQALESWQKDLSDYASSQGFTVL